MYLIYLMIGATTGLLSGLIGIGGGMIVVPCLLMTFHYLHFDSSAIMPVVVATSFAVVIITSLRSFQAHRTYQLPYQAIVLRLLPGVVIGCVCGALLSHHIKTHDLTVMFGILMFVNAIWMLLPHPKQTHTSLPSPMAMSMSGLILGALCSMLGIGGSVFIIPYLNHYDIDMHLAVLVSIVMSLIIASISIMMSLMTGWHAQGLPPHTIGYVYWPAWLAIIIGSVICAPLGARLSRQLPVNRLRQLFAVFLVLISIDMVFFT